MRRTIATIAALATVAILVAACTGAGVLPTWMPDASTGPIGDPTYTRTASSTGPPAATPAPTLSTSSPDAWLVVGRKGVGGLEVVLASTGERLYELPSGVPSADWGRLVAATATSGRTAVRDLVVQPGFGGPERALDGAWRLPTIGADPTPVGVSADGQTIVLVEDRVADAAVRTSRFAILTRGFVRAPRIVTLTGSFEYDAISPNGATLYVVQHLAGTSSGRYQVRAVDVASGVLREGVVADKRNLAEPMAGWPIAQVRQDDGAVFTLYRGVAHPFVHALDTVNGTAVCIDLPATGVDDAAAVNDWGLAASPDGRSIYAANATFGRLEELDPAGLGIRRSVSLRPLAAGGIVLAKFGHQDSGPVGRRVAVGPDGRAIYAAGAGGILMIDAADLAVTDRFLVGMPVEAIAVTPDGGTLYALLRDGGRIVKLDAATGNIVGHVPSSGYDRLLAVVPW